MTSDGTGQPTSRQSSSGVCVRSTTRSDGDFRIDGDLDDRAARDARRRAVVDLPWVWLRQVHGARVVTVSADTVESSRGVEADALVTAESGLAVAVQTADCVPVALWSAEGIIGVAHAGWRGVEAGVIPATVATMRGLGATEVLAAVGPHLTVEGNEFSVADLDRLAAQFGDGVRGTTVAGRPAFDIDAALRSVFDEVNVVIDTWDPRDTARDGADFYSHRARKEPQRMTTVIWRSAVPS